MSREDWLEAGKKIMAPKSHEVCKRLAVSILREVYSRKSLDDALIELDMLLLARVPIGTFRRMWRRVLRLPANESFFIRFAGIMAEEINRETLFEVFMALRLGGLTCVMRCS
jgi:hypothetical protein